MATANHVLLRRITLTTSASSVEFSNLPQTGYTDLKLVMSGRITGYSGVSYDYIGITFNGDTTSSYSNKALYGNGSSVGSFDVPSTTSIRQMITMPSDAATSNVFGNAELYIPSYTSSINKSVSTNAITENNATQVYNQIGAGVWAKTDSIAAINMFPLQGTAFVAGSSFSLYGIADVNTTPKSSPKADGGDIIKTDGTYWYHAFLSTGVFKPQLNLTCDYLVVAGGGGSGSAASTGGGGGGGAGGLRSTLTATGGGGSVESAITTTANTSYTITVGAGGAGSPYGGSNGTNGSNSVFSTITSIGGGRGASAFSSIVGQSGGSGGGGGSAGSNYQGGSGTANQGYAGGSGDSTGYGGAGGGGGAGAVGGNAYGSYPTPQPQGSGSGGAGVSLSVWASATGTGVSNYYAGGGGGGFNQSGGIEGAGGAGGGGAGSEVTGNPGTANTGGGAGGGGYTGSNYAGGNGGSGIVIIRYPV